jgi:PPOX class probable F420-dependent enzyme
VDEAKARLDSGEVGWITTVDGGGQAQSSPVWFVWDQVAIHVATRPDAAKVRNVAGNPRVAFHLDGTGPGDVVVTLEGTATVTDRLDDAVADAYVAKYAAGIGRLGITAGEYFEEFTAAVRITPSRWRVFRSD